MSTTYCPNCDKDKPDKEFGPHASRPNGLQPYCRDCTNARQRAWKAKNREKVLESKRLYREKKKAERATATAR